MYLGHYQRSSNCPNRTREVIKSVVQVSCQKDEKALPKDVMEESGGIVGSGGDREGDYARFDDYEDEHQLSRSGDDGEDGDDSSRFSTSSSSDENENEDNDYAEDDDNESDEEFFYRKDINNDEYDDYSGQCAKEKENEIDIESLTDLTDIGNDNNNLYSNANGAELIPLELEQACSILRHEFQHDKLNQFHGCVSAPILDFLHPKEGKEDEFEHWIEEAKQWGPKILAGIAFQSSRDSRNIYAIKGKHGLDSDGYDCKVSLIPNCLSKSTCLPGIVWPQDIQDFVDVADVPMGVMDYTHHVLAYNSVIFSIGSIPVGDARFWNTENNC